MPIPKRPEPALADLAYDDDSPAQRLDLYLPNTCDGLAPLIVHIHGGGFVEGDKADAALDEWLPLLAKGFAVASINYRLAGEAIFPAAVIDCRQAVRWLKTHGLAYGLDPRRVVPLGWSAGGTLAGMLAMNVPNGAFPGESTEAHYAADASVAAAIDLYGPADLAAFDGQARAIGVFDAEQPDWWGNCYLGAIATQVPELAAQADPASYASPAMSPLLIQHGDADTLVPCAQSAVLAKTIVERAGERYVRFDTMVGAEHDDPMFSTAENLDAIVAFIDRHAPAAPYVKPLPVEAAFPASTWQIAGMTSLNADLAPRYGSARLGVQYAVKSGRALHLQILLPPMPPAGPDDPATLTRRFPVVVYVKGSAWMEQNLGLELPGLADFTKRGYVVAVVEYRPSSVAPFPAQVRDVRTAIGFLRDNADEFHIDPSQVVLWGDSSGGHTTLMVYLTQSDQYYSDEPLARLGVSCFVDYYGPTDISRMNEEPSIQDHIGASSPEGQLIGGLDVWANQQAAAPTIVMNHVQVGEAYAPLLMVHGGSDRIVPFAQSVMLYQALVDAGAPVKLYRLEGADHGGPPFWQPAVLDIVDQFIRASLGGVSLISQAD